MAIPFTSDSPGLGEGKTSDDTQCPILDAVCNPLITPDISSVTEGGTADYDTLCSTPNAVCDSQTTPDTSPGPCLEPVGYVSPAPDSDIPSGTDGNVIDSATSDPAMEVERTFTEKMYDKAVLSYQQASDTLKTHMDNVILLYTRKDEYGLEKVVPSVVIKDLHSWQKWVEFVDEKCKGDKLTSSQKMLKLTQNSLDRTVQTIDQWDVLDNSMMRAATQCTLIMVVLKDAVNIFTKLRDH